MKENEKLVTIAEFENGFDAELALDNAGINSVVLGEEIGAIRPYSTIFNVVLQVFESDVEKAKQILAEKNELGEDENVESDQ